MTGSYITPPMKSALARIREVEGNIIPVMLFGLDAL